MGVEISQYRGFDKPLKFRSMTRRNKRIHREIQSARINFIGTFEKKAPAEKKIRPRKGRKCNYLPPQEPITIAHAFISQLQEREKEGKYNTFNTEELVQRARAEMIINHEI